MSDAQLVTGVDFVPMPTRDLEAAVDFYGSTMGLPRSVYIPERNYAEFQLGENISLYLIDPTNIGSSFTGPHTAHIALRVPDVAATREELEGRGVEFDGEILDTGVCHMAFFADPDGNALMLHHRYAPRATES